MIPDSYQALPLVPQLSTERLLSHPDNESLQRIMRDDAETSVDLKDCKIAVITTDGVEEIELLATLKYLRDHGASVDLVAPKMPQLPASLGVEMPAIRENHILTIRYINVGGWVPIDRFVDEIDSKEYHAVIIPGGAWNPDALRSDPSVLQVVQQTSQRGALIAAICHGPWVLSDAGLLDGKNATCWWSMKKDIENAGATFLDQPVVQDGDLITSRFPGDLPAFLETIHQALNSRLS